MSDAPTDYDAVPLPDPDVKPYPEWSPDERRALLLREVLAAGGPTRLNKAAFARRFDLNRATVSRDDMEALAASVAYHLADDERIALDVRSAFHRIYDALLDDGDYEAAWRVVKDYAGWLGEAGLVSRAPTKHEVRTGDLPPSDGEYAMVVDDGEGERVVTAEDITPVLPDEGDGDPSDPTHRIDGPLE